MIEWIWISYAVTTRGKVHLVKDKPEAVSCRRLTISCSHNGRVGRRRSLLPVKEKWKNNPSRIEYWISFLSPTKRDKSLREVVFLFAYHLRRPCLFHSLSRSSPSISLPSLPASLHLGPFPLRGQFQYLPRQLFLLIPLFPHKYLRSSYLKNLHA